jgi:hypothetical protein
VHLLKAGSPNVVEAAFSEVCIASVQSPKFAHAGKRRHDRPACFGGYVTITVEHDDGGERDEAVPCWRCKRTSSG